MCIYVHLQGSLHFVQEQEFPYIGRNLCCLHIPSKFFQTQPLPVRLPQSYQRQRAKIPSMYGLPTFKKTGLFRWNLTQKYSSLLPLLV